MFNCFLKTTKWLKHVRNFSTELPVREVSIPVPWGEIRGKWWGPTDKIPILTLHGWQDNCGSFDRLIPLLNADVGYLAVDYPGHGYSSPLPPGIFYNVSTFLLTIERVRKYFKWPQVSLLGHSYGGIKSFMYSIIFPERVDFIACIDIHPALLITHQLEWLQFALEEFMKNNEHFMSKNEPPSYTINEMKKRIHEPNNQSILKEYANYIITRNVAPSKIHPGKYYFTRDPRVKPIEIFRITMDELRQYAKRLKSPLFLVKAVSANSVNYNQQFYDVLPILQENNRDLEFHIVEGTHHVHLNNPENIADILSKFIRKHSGGDRTIDPISKDTFVSDEKDPRIKYNIVE